jgi:hypothetical protein
VILPSLPVMPIATRWLQDQDGLEFALAALFLERRGLWVGPDLVREYDELYFGSRTWASRRVPVMYLL